MDDKINRRNFLKLDKFTFSFKMTDHLNPGISKDNCLTVICEKISSYHKSKFPKWTRLLRNSRIIEITQENELFKYLDENSKNKEKNWLIFSRDDRRITVIHFGPFGKKKEDDFGGKVHQSKRGLKQLEDKWLQVYSSSLPEEQKEAELTAIENKVTAEYQRATKIMEEKIEAKKRELTEVAEAVFTSTETRERIKKDIKNIRGKAAWVIVRDVLAAVVAEITCELIKRIASMAAKETAKQGAKGVAKEVVETGLKEVVIDKALGAGIAVFTTAKVVPFLGWAVGTGFAILRLVEGDVVGAGLEVSSGVASCVPGAGTAASLAIDGVLVAKDVGSVIQKVNRKKEKMEAMKAETERIERELKKLFAECEKAKQEHNFICEVLRDPGYDFDKLKHDMKVVEEVLRDLRKTRLLFFF